LLPIKEKTPRLFVFVRVITMDDLEKIIEQLEAKTAKETAQDPVVRASLDIVKEFLQERPVLCYGGTAINNLLPEKDRFYDPEVDIPDYDFYSKTPQEHALLLANKLAAAGIKTVEVRPGVHAGTFKVFADFQGVADITHLDRDIFDRLWAADVVRGGIHYVTPNFLRMGMYLELSRPRGDVSRWTKVYKRLTLLNNEFPMVCPGVPEEPALLSDEHRKEVERILRKEPVVLLGITASQIHLGKRTPQWSAPADIIADPDTIERLIKGKTVKKYEATNILPMYYEVMDNKTAYLRIHETNACHSYHETANGVRVASIPTLLQFFFAYLYSGASEAEMTRILCVAQRLVDIADQKPKRRFALLTPIDCIGTQDSLVDIRRHKSVLYDKLSKNKNSVDFLKYFFNYNNRLTKTQKKKIRDALNKTRRARYESSY
jgi:hypothetical protein